MCSSCDVFIMCSSCVHHVFIMCSSCDVFIMRCDVLIMCSFNHTLFCGVHVLLCSEEDVGMRFHSFCFIGADVLFEIHSGGLVRMW
jgi:hypothetical protein